MHSELFLITSYLLYDSIPHNCKVANVTSVLRKKFKNAEANNYRPICLTS